jgi:hypothetical protein
MCAKDESRLSQEPSPSEHFLRYLSFGCGLREKPPSLSTSPTCPPSRSGGRGSRLYKPTFHRGSVCGAHPTTHPTRIHPLEAQRIVAENVLPYFQIVPLDNHGYLDAMDIMSRGGWSGARIYDALILQCAAKCPAARIYTFNLSDFRQLAPPDLQEKICSP